MTTFLIAAGVLVGLGVVLAVVLGYVSRRWHVHEDPKVAPLEEVLPGINCGACGYAGCHEYAVALAEGRAEVGLCTPGGPKCAAALASILGTAPVESAPVYAIVHCGARSADRGQKPDYRGERTCFAATMTPGVQACVYGCLGFGDCERACPFDAIHVIDSLAEVDYARCTGCGACVRACPRHIISLAPFKADLQVVVACSNRDPGKNTRAVCPVGCIACRQCERTCDLFHVQDNLSHLDYGRYDPARADELQTASAKCPVHCLPWRGRTHEPRPERPEA